ncbi:PepSY domain-containing protein [Solibacillus sp. MA9]|uniref:PepSY domain-containing protein n=1 Tax=Solibacillus palustris TaxID=2908203 RepID=A0ABS9UCI2_9BACL|nr:PepSY domain-containing protein [Solibacillus sp. MA9]MCH7321840.1 PepSY domain-containing protein [Solibacillus sp. MA9]
MKKKLVVIPALLVAIGGGVLLAQSDYFEAASVNPEVTAGEAKKIALKEFTGDIISFDFDYDDGQPHYEIDIVKDSEKAELEVDAMSGAVKITERETISQSTNQKTSSVTKIPTNTATISEQQAQEIALAQANGTITEIELDDDDDHGFVYEIEIRNGKMEYDFKIDATTGAIVEYKEDLED